MRKITPKYQTRLNHLMLLHKKYLLALPREYKKKNHNYKLWYKKHLIINKKKMKLLYRYEHKCKCGAIIKLRFNECIDCQNQNNY